MSNEFEIKKEFKIPDEYEPFFDDCVMAIPNSNNTCDIKSEECIKLKSKYISSKSFYKYYSPKEYNIKAFENDELYLSRAQDFNDPFDCYFESPYSIEMNLNKNKMFFNLKEYNFKKIKEVFFTKMGVACLSTDGESPLMWAHYAENSKGFCVEYKFDKNFQNSNYARADVSLMPVLYFKNSYYNSCTLIKDFLCFRIKTKSFQSGFNACLYKNMLCKGKDWNKEKEWRIVHNVFGCDETRKRKIKMPFPKAIYLGINMDQLLKEQLINVVIDKNKKNSNEKPIEVYQCHLTPSSGFKFKYDKIDLSNLNSLFE